MAYATVADDVQPRIGANYTLTIASNPTTTQVERLIAEASARIDSALRAAGYTTVPATGANDLIMLRGKVADYVALKSLFIIFGYDQVPQSAIEAFGGFNDFIKSINDGEEVLIDQSPTVATIGMIQAAVYGRESMTTDYRCNPYRGLR